MTQPTFVTARDTRLPDGPVSARANAAPGDQRRLPLAPLTLTPRPGPAAARSSRHV